MLFRYAEDYLDLRRSGETAAGEPITFQVEYYIEEYGRSGVLWDELLWPEELPGLVRDLERLLTGQSRDVFFQNRRSTFILWLEAGEQDYTLRLRIGTRPDHILWTHTTDRDTVIRLFNEVEELTAAR